MSDESEVKKVNPWFGGTIYTAMGVGLAYGVGVAFHLVTGGGGGQWFKWVKPDAVQLRSMHDLAVTLGISGFVAGHLGARLVNKDREIDHLKREMEKIQALSKNAASKS